MIASNFYSAFFITVLVSGCAFNPDVRPDFRKALEHHLDAVSNRNLQGIEETVIANPDLSLIFPNGRLVSTRREFIDFHREWFKDLNWIYDAKIEKVVEGPGVSFALVRYSYQDSIDDPAREAWLTLIFQLESGSWRLVHDQNTSIQ